MITCNGPKVNVARHYTFICVQIQFDKLIKITQIPFYLSTEKTDFDNYAGWRQGYIKANKPLIKKYKNKWDLWYNKHNDMMSLPYHQVL